MNVTATTTKLCVIRFLLCAPDPERQTTFTNMAAFVYQDEFFRVIFILYCVTGKLSYISINTYQTNTVKNVKFTRRMVFIHCVFCPRIFILGAIISFPIYIHEKSFALRFFSLKRFFFKMKCEELFRWLTCSFNILVVGGA